MNQFAEWVAEAWQHHLDHRNDPPPKFVIPDWLYDMAEAQGCDMSYYKKVGQ